MCRVSRSLFTSARVEQFHCSAFEQICGVGFFVTGWNNCSSFRLAQKEAKYSHVLLELLKVFPEELQNRSLRIGDNRRNAVQHELATQTEPVLAFLVCKSRIINRLINFRNTFVVKTQLQYNQKLFQRLAHGYQISNVQVKLLLKVIFCSRLLWLW